MATGTGLWATSMTPSSWTWPRTWFLRTTGLSFPRRSGTCSLHRQSLCLRLFLPSPHPHAPCPPPCPLLWELNRDSPSCPKPAPHSWGAGSPGHTRPGLVLISSPSPALPMLLCSLWLWCCCTFSPLTLRLPSVWGSPILVLCTWAPFQGLGSQPSPTPQHWNLFASFPLGVEG